MGVNWGMVAALLASAFIGYLLWDRWNQACTRRMRDSATASTALALSQQCTGAGWNGRRVVMAPPRAWTVMPGTKGEGAVFDPRHNRVVVYPDLNEASLLTVWLGCHERVHATGSERRRTAFAATLGTLPVVGFAGAIALIAQHVWPTYGLGTLGGCGLVASLSLLEGLQLHEEQRAVQGTRALVARFFDGYGIDVSHDGDYQQWAAARVKWERRRKQLDHLRGPAFALFGVALVLLLHW